MRLLGTLGLALAVAVTPVPSASVVHAATTLVIGVDHADAANQQPFPPSNRVFEYSDFFSRSVTVHQGDTIDFQVAPFSFHSVALASRESVAREVYPVASDDVDGDGADIATASRAPKIIFGSGNFPVTGGSTHGGGVISTNNPEGPPVCGVAALGESPCHFKGGDDIEILGPTPGFTASAQPASFDQNVVIDAPPGTYAYFDMLHPGMSGTLTVVGPNDSASTQPEIDAASQQQFQEDRSQGLQVESALNSMQEGWGQPGQRHFVVFVGAAAANDHVQIDEMFPNKPLNLARGDTVSYVWADPHAGHTLGITPDEKNLPGAVGYDCGTNSPGYVGIETGFDAPPSPPPAGCSEPQETQPELIGDPGNAPQGTSLSDPSQTLDAGHLLGTAYGLHPSAQAWAATTGSSTQAGAYTFVCSIHAWMTGTIDVS